MRKTSNKFIALGLLLFVVGLVYIGRKVVGMDLEDIRDWFAGYTYQPLIVYAAIFGFMFICSLGVPIPEEVIIISAGLAGHISLNPEEYPPPYPGAPMVNPHTLAAVCFLAVIITDYFIFSMGKVFGKQIMRSDRFQTHFTDEKMDRIRGWVKKYGFWAPSVFRFIPGVRFPGHLMCGALGVSQWTFLLTDGLAALFSVPTQVYLVSYYGEDILTYVKKFKIFVFGALALLLVVYLVRRFVLSRRATI